MSKETWEQVSQKVRDKGAQCGGWLSDSDKYWLSEWLLSLKIEKPVVVEIGVFQGGTSTLFLEALPDCTLYVVDDWLGGPPSPPYDNIKDAFIAYTKPYEDRIVFHSGDSKEIGEKWHTPMDICMVDGCHNDEYPAWDINNFSKYLRVGGFLLVDDYQMKDVKSAVDVILRSNAQKWRLVKEPETANGGDLIVFQKVS